METAPAFCVAIDPSPRLPRAAAASLRSERLEVLATFPASELVMVAEKFASLPRAAASSFSVSRAPGEPLTTAATAAATKAVVASCVELVPAMAVGAVGVPVSAGDAKGALSASAASSPVTSEVE